MRIILLTLFLVFTGCAKEYESGKTKMQIRFPASAKKSALRHYRAASAGPRLPKFTSLDDIDCYGIMVQYNNGTGQGTCNDTNGNLVMSGINLVFGTIADGGVIEIELDSGPARSIHIVGLTSTLGYCPDLYNMTAAENNAISDPTIVGSTTADIAGEFMEVNINLSMTGAQQIDECSGGPFTWEMGNSGGIGYWDQANWDQDQWGQ